MKILVTGGCGFIGSHIVDAYIDMGHKVSIIDNLSTGDIKNLNPEAKFFKEDIRSQNIKKIFEEGKFDVVNHHAAQINVRVSAEDPLFDADVNIIGSLNLMSAALRYGVKKFIFASSGGTVYGEPKELPITEDYPIRPNSPYGISKATFERYLTLFSLQHNIDYVILRYSNVYGPRQISKSEAGVISIFIEQILKNKECVVFGDGAQTRDFVYVADVVNANISALTCDSVILNIGTGIETSVNELIDMLSEITGQRVAHRHDAPRLEEVRRNVIDPTKAESLIQWRPIVSLKEGIRRTFEYFQKIS
ncbi:MAG TPA: NAD-dependent epimerase/dehydratase family protein [candidate division WOR-3 bacterium]|uniref:NAD-dependent epimerase/dehydratase family protein n=1 Tax=candidate division WOR-3 bacterium TaxID=2052148 RepID=A0A9C9JZG4_UNCW3|nr:NAD-dependent epimerase/dehydratase family protein [candidate division WOR-3 bacterium]